MKYFTIWLLVSFIPIILIYLGVGFVTWGSSFDMSSWSLEARGSAVIFSFIWAIITALFTMEASL